MDVERTRARFGLAEGMNMYVPATGSGDEARWELGSIFGVQGFPVLESRDVGVELWSDFDGTVVEKRKWYEPRNWTKYPLGGIEGYGDFIQGVEDAEVKIAGVISRRPDIAQRRHVTQKSIAALGLAGVFSDESVHLLGSDGAKAAMLIDRSKEAVVGMIDDNSHDLALHALAQSALRRTGAHRHPIVLGAVSGTSTDERVDNFLQDFRNLGIVGSQVSVEENGYQSDGYTSDTIRVSTRNDIGLSLEIVALPEYSHSAGDAFARHLLRAAARAF